MDFQIVDYGDTAGEDAEITTLLAHVFVGEGYTDSLYAKKSFQITELRKRGKIILARSSKAALVGMAICVPPSSQARQVAAPGEAEIHLLAVDPKARRRGIATHLILACERHATIRGYSKMVLSTQPDMKTAHRIYQRLEYSRNVNRDWSRGEDRVFFVYEKSLKSKN